MPLECWISKAIDTLKICKIYNFSVTTMVTRTHHDVICTLPVVLKSLLRSIYLVGVRDGAVGWGTALQTGSSRVRFPMVSLQFFIDIILPVALWPWGWLSLWQKWVPGIFPGDKSGRCVGLTTLSPSCAHCLEIWESQPPGTLRACPGL